MDIDIGDQFIEYKLYYPNSWEREEHIAKHLISSYSTLLTKANDIIKDDTSSNSTLHICNHCDQTFDSNNKLISHVQVKHVDKSYTCPFCYEQSITKDHLKVCSKVEINKKLYRCEECKKCFDLKCNLRTHLKRHRGEKPFECTKCGKCFIYNCRLKVHMKCHDAEDKQFKCPKCDKCFRRKGYLRQHWKFHLNHMPYRCKTCNEYFMEISHLTGHMKTHYVT